LLASLIKLADNTCSPTQHAFIDYFVNVYCHGNGNFEELRARFAVIGLDSPVIRKQHLGPQVLAN
jgi:hypothetical protein